MSRELSKYLILLKKEANRLERTDINNDVDDTFRAKYGTKILFSLLSCLMIWLLKAGFENDFVSFVSSVLSILVGLFITALIFSFDKFYDPTIDENSNSRIKLWHTQAYNYAKKFAYITSYTIVLSVFTLVLLSVSALFKQKTQLNIFELSFCLDTKEWDYESFKLMLVASFVLFQRFFVVYWLLKIMYNTLYIVSSMVQYMTTKIDRK